MWWSPLPWLPSGWNEGPSLHSSEQYCAHCGAPHLRSALEGPGPAWWVVLAVVGPASHTPLKLSLSFCPCWNANAASTNLQPAPPSPWQTHGAEGKCRCWLLPWLRHVGGQEVVRKPPDPFFPHHSLILAGVWAVATTVWYSQWVTTFYSIMPAF